MSNFNSELREWQQIPRELINDSSMSDRARFVYCYMACKPDGWFFYLDPMAKELGYTVATLRKYITELINTGWLTKTAQDSDENGRFGSNLYTLHAKKCDRTHFEPCYKKTDTVNLPCGKKTDSVKVAHYNIETNKDKEINKEDKESAPDKSGTLFPDADKEVERLKAEKAEARKRKTLFCNCELGIIETFLARFSEIEELKNVDLYHYFNAVSRFSDKSDVKRTLRGWVATVYDFIDRDSKEGKLRTIDGSANNGEQKAYNVLKRLANG